jgi:hypothetical protein
MRTRILPLRKLQLTALEYRLLFLFGMYKIPDFIHIVYATSSSPKSFPVAV